jgi:hypothetical protein
MSDWEPLVHIGAVRGPMELIGGDSSSPTIGLVITKYEYTHTAVTDPARSDPRQNSIPQSTCQSYQSCAADKSPLNQPKVIEENPNDTKGISDL